ncbi:MULTISPECIES: C40 family peptidase [Oceanobacillus]|uniref:Peptidase P60 n=1 Tax=Oceanobacillus kimchii TaxID=746691 RepID=A0ABQ5TJL7_9BACI|nr:MULTISPECIES: C40 family peptidase [Oceanobacillus]MBT2601149.1 C40 family peptidase [Oceanobacillus sp. ISL-74]MBT2652375.1 C40 family peptidase [Oceanobacillus sp. ISL-73]MCT1579034.1 NlpC/P60 family protein [Oceanobacillus kimchii]MCT2137438.1 NlpC/P60 family protein [Oceanobacillus kimchii]GLO67068.1 peptidase P60 [Oceanobacillus kimchii]
MLKKVIFTLTTATVVGLSSTLFTGVAHAETIEDLESQQSQIQEDRDAIKADLSDAESEIADVLIELEELNKEIERVDKALKENENKMDETQDKISEQEAEVEKLEEEIAELEEAIEKRYEILKERAISLQQSGGEITYLEVIFGAQDFGDFINRVQAVNKITDSDTSLIEQQEADKKEVETKQDEVVSKLDDLKEMEVEIKGMLATIEEQKSENEVKKDDLKEKEDNLVAMKNELEVEDSKLATLEKDVERSLSTATSPAPNTTVASASVGTDSKSDNNNVTRTSGSGGVSTAINAGFNHLGTPYVWGGKSPSGFDCSGFVSWAFAQGGISIPSSTSALASTGSKVSASNMQPGDIVFFDTYKTNGHVGIYLGGGQFIGAQNSTGLAVADMTSGYWADKFSGHVRSVR